MQNPDFLIMKKICYILTGMLAVMLSSCGYHLGGVKPANMQNMNTFCVEMFENNTVQPNVGVLMTTAMANALQSDGTYRMAPRNEADFIVKGAVTHISRDSLIANTEDSYVSTYIALNVHAKYEVVDRKTGARLAGGSTSGRGSYFTQVGNTQSAIDTTLSYATRCLADDITLSLTTK